MNFGFGLKSYVPTAQYIFIKLNAGSTWYTLTDGDPPQQQPLESKSLYGKLESMSVVTLAGANGDRIKLDIHIQADRPYVIRSGLSSVFSRGFLSAMLRLDDPGQPIWIAPTIERMDRVGLDTVCCSIYDSKGNYVKTGSFVEKGGEAIAAERILKVMGLGLSTVKTDGQPDTPPSPQASKQWGQRIQKLSNNTPSPVTGIIPNEKYQFIDKDEAFDVLTDRLSAEGRDWAKFTNWCNTQFQVASPADLSATAIAQILTYLDTKVK